MMSKEEVEKKLAGLEQERQQHFMQAQAQLLIYEGRIQELKSMLEPSEEKEVEKDK